MLTLAMHGDRLADAKPSGGTDSFNGANDNTSTGELELGVHRPSSASHAWLPGRGGPEPLSRCYSLASS